MHTWKLEIEYEGTRYRGWQIQHNAKTVQGELTAAARQLFSERIEIGGSGRTDAGVHAIQQIAHLKAPYELKANITPRQIQHGFNDILPHDINVKKVTNAPENFDARKHAVQRYYLYQISTRRTAFAKNFVWWIKDSLNVKEMQECAELLAGRHDFYSFHEEDEGKKSSTVVNVSHAEVFTDGDLICFRIGASHFLWKMVRRIVGMLAEVGRGSSSVSDFARLIKFKSTRRRNSPHPLRDFFSKRFIQRRRGESAEKSGVFFRIAFEIVFKLCQIQNIEVLRNF